MDLTVCTLLVVLFKISFIHSERVSRTVSENVTFYYERLPVTPSITANIEFTVSYSQRSMDYKYPIMGIYTTYPLINIDNRCSKIHYAQLHNENLHPILRVGRYRTTTCELSGSDTVNCRGRVTVQDYIPRNFHLTFGFHCDWPRIYSLNGLRYNISFFNQSNRTSGCTDYSVIRRSRACSRFYKETSVPNLIGEEDLGNYEDYFAQSTFFEALVFLDETCYQHLWKIACYVLLPKCDVLTQQVKHPCGEMCQDVLEGCWQKLWALLARMSSEFRYNNNFIFFPSIDKLKFINCDYLPFLHGSVPCFYKNVTCDSPPDVTNGTRIINATEKNVYELYDVVQYACVNETFTMKGKSTITCLYNEEFEDCYMENMKDPAFKLFVILMQPADTLDITNEYIQSFFTKKTYLEWNDSKLFLKIANYLTWVKQAKGEKPPLDGDTEDIIDPLLSKNGNQNEDEIADKIMVEEYKENIKLRNVDNGIERDVCSEDSDEEPVISYRHNDDESGDESLDVGGMKSNFKNPTDDGYMETLVEVHHVDSG